MRKLPKRHNTFGTVWQFRTKRFTIDLQLERDWNYRYDGDDEGGEIQAALDSGELVAFDAACQVFFDDELIAVDHLGGSVYEADAVAEFYKAHRDLDPMNRNCTIAREANVSIGHYFPDMVRNAIAEARAAVLAMPSVPYVRNTGT